MKRPMSNELRKKIKMHIKNRIDISDLIKDVNIKGEDLSRAIIKDFSRPDDDISGCNFYQAVIGEENKITNLNRVTAKNCNFHRAKLLGTIWLRNTDVRGSNFKETYLAGLDYKFANFRGCNLCGAIFCISSGKGIGAKFDANFFQDLTENWGIEVRLKNKEKENGK